MYAYDLKELVMLHKPRFMKEEENCLNLHYERRRQIGRAHV